MSFLSSISIKKQLSSTQLSCEKVFTFPQTLREAAVPWQEKKRQLWHVETDEKMKF